jgi:hypothetical protein
MIRATVWHMRGTPSLSAPSMAHGRTPKNVSDQLESMRADDGNRTRMTSLEGSQFRFSELRFCSSEQIFVTRK